MSVRVVQADGERRAYDARPMPRLVDHHERRRVVAEYAARLVSQGGLDAVTMRDVAAVAGTSTAIVSHYFRDKNELLRYTYTVAADAARGRIAAVLAADPGNVRGACESLLPIDDDRRQDWRIWFAFWGLAASEPSFAEVHRDRTRFMVDTLTRAVRAARPEMRANQAREIARGLLTVVVGIASQATFDPAEWTPSQQRRAMTTQIGLLLPER
jgi:AcrR family transcriptional regulator